MTGPSFAPSWDQVWVYAWCLGSDGAPIPGRWQFQLSAPRVINHYDIPAWAKVFLSRPITVEADDANDQFPGLMRVRLLSTDDPQNTPVGTTYQVAEPSGARYTIVVPWDTPILNAPGDPDGGVAPHPLHGLRAINLARVVPISTPTPGLAQVVAGPRGSSIVSAEGVNGDLVLTLDDATELDPVPLPAGPPGTPGVNGINGVPGTDGAGFMQTPNPDFALAEQDQSGRVCRWVDNTGATWVKLRDDTVFPGAHRYITEPPAGSGYSFAVVDQNRRAALLIDDAGSLIASIPRVVDARGRSVRAMSGLPITAYGDSTTEGADLTNMLAERWTTLLGTALGETVENQGKSGATSGEVAGRQGGLTISATITGGTIPTSGGVAVTNLVPDVHRVGDGTALTVSIDGITGVLSRSGANRTFTRSAAGSAYSPPGGVAGMVCLEGTDRADRIQIIAAGINDESAIEAGTLTVEDVKANLARMITSLRPVRPRFLVWSMLDRGEAEGATTSRGLLIRQVSAYLAATYGANFVDVRAHLSARGLAEAGITPTTQDTADMAAGAVPISLRSAVGSVHLNAAGHTVQAALFARILRRKGWTA